MSVNKKQIIEKTYKYAKKTLEGEGSGHDWWHVYRVWQMAKKICKTENADMFIVELASLLHDIADYKLNGGDMEIGPRTAEKWLVSLGVDEKVVKHVKQIIKDINFKGGGVKDNIESIEGKIVMDADRLDAIGAIGIARTFAYGGFKKRPIYDPEVNPILYRSFEEYKNNTPPTITHFYEKLLLLKDRMNTKTAKKIAIERHGYMKTYLNRFYKEWDGKV